MDPDSLLADAERSDELASSTRVEELAVLATFDPARLIGSADGRDILRLLCKRIPTPQGRPAAILRERRRIDALASMLERGGPAELARIRAAIDPGDDSPLQRMLDGFVLGPGTPVGERDEDELMASLEVWRWATEAVAQARLSSSVRVEPGRDLIEGRLALLDVTRPVRKLTEAGCIGRDTELSRLHAYLDEPGGGPGLRAHPPMVVYGIGGVGKSTLIARLVMDLDEAGQRGTPRAWAYLDLDRPTISSGTPEIILDDIFNQVAAQFPEHRKTLLRDVGVARLRMRGSGAESSDAISYFGRVAGFARVMDSITGGSLVVVLDSFEELERRQSPREIEALSELFASLASQLPAFRLIVSGRSPAAAFASDARPDRQMHVLPFASEAATSLLRFFVEREAPQAVPSVDDELATEVIRLVGGIPLTVRLAASVLAREGADAITDAAERAHAISRIRTEFVQGFLYQRILNHITAPDPSYTEELRHIAQASLALRRITPVLIEEVLQPAIAYQPASPSSWLFKALASEVALVEQQDEVLRLREELRGPALAALRLQDPQLVRRVHQLAANYYQDAPDPEAAIELAYHQLAAGHPASTTDADVLRRLEPFLADFPASAASTIRRALDEPTTLNTAQDLAAWERQVLPEIDAAIRNGQPEQARQLLAQRTERSPGTELYRLQSRAEEEQGNLHAAVSTALQDVDAAEAAADPERVVSAVVRLAALYERLAEPLSAQAALRRAEEALLLTGYPELRLELLLNRMNTGERGELDSEEARWSLGLDARALLQRSDSRRVNASTALARLLAAALGREEPERIQQAVRRIGLGHEGNPLRVQAVIAELTAWDAGQPEPGRLAPLSGLPASPDDPGRAWAALATLGAEAGPLLDRLWRAEPFPASVREALRKLYLWWAAELRPAPPVATPAGSDFLTQVPLDWARAETRELEDILVTAYPTSTEMLELAARVGINPSIINWNAPSSVIGHSILTVASQQARLDELIIAMWIDPSAPYAGTRLRALLGEGWGESHGLREPSDVAVADPLETVWLPNGAPLVNRAQLRKGVRELLRPGGVRILVVNGPPGSGKSYSAAFIRGIGQATGEFKVAQVQHWPGSEPDYGPAELARDLGSQLGIEQRPTSAETSDWAYYWMLVADLVGAATDSRESWWWILDGFSSGGRQDIMEFILLLAEQATANSDVRLVLLGYDRPHLGQLEGLAYREEISPISESDIREFLTALSRTARRATDEESIEQSIGTIFTDLPMDKQRNVTLGVRVLKAAGQFAR